MYLLELVYERTGRRVPLASAEREPPLLPLVQALRLGHRAVRAGRATVALTPVGPS